MLIGELHEARLRGESEAPVLASADLRPASTAVKGRASSEDATLYFIARCLLDRRDPRSRLYFRQCIRRNPWHVRAWCLLPFAELLFVSSRREPTT
jgi:hypothetical protein